MADADYRRLAPPCVCGVELPFSGGRGRPRKYCGLDCQPNYKGNAYARIPTKVVECAGCGIKLQTKSSQRKWCAACRCERARTKASQPLGVEKACAAGGCNGVFSPSLGSHRRYCSTACRVADGNRRQAIDLALKKAAEPPLKCLWCSAIFQRKVGDRRRRYCSQRCKLSHGYSVKGHNVHVYRAKKFGVPWESVNKAKVFERDRWRCQLCGDKVTRANAQLDHILPISRGGPHTYDNTQCACAPCNRAKGNRPLGQALLFG